MNKNTRESLEKEKKELESKLTGDMMKDMDLKDKIHNLQMKLDGVKPSTQEIDCEGCGS